MATLGSSTTGLDVASIRSDFPALEQSVRGKPLVYLDNAATTQKPKAVIEAVRSYYSNDNANVHRGVHALSARATRMYDDARRTVASFVNASRPEEIVFVRGTTEAINLLAHSLGQSLQAGDEILLSSMEHHSNIVPWQLAAQRTGAVIRVVPISDVGELDLDAYAKLLGPRTKIVSIMHVSNALGSVNPIETTTRLAKDVGATVIVDGAQSAPHMPIDVQKLAVDFYAFSGHKVYGPTGIGALYGRYELLETMPPFMGGGDMIRTVSFEGTTYAPPPAKFEAGTPNIAGAIGLAEAIRYVQGIGLDAIGNWENVLTQAATEALEAMPGVRLIGTSPHKTGVLSFLLEGAHPHDIGTILDMHGIAVRAGHHCAQPLMQRLGVAATARASFGVYNTLQEVEALADGLREVGKVLGL